MSAHELREAITDDLKVFRESADAATAALPAIARTRIQTILADCLAWMTTATDEICRQRELLEALAALEESHDGESEQPEARQCHL